MFKAENIKTIDMLESERVANKLTEEVTEAKKFLNSTDFKMTVDYFNTLTKEEQNELITKRAEAREFVRDNEI